MSGTRLDATVEPPPADAREQTGGRARPLLSWLVGMAGYVTNNVIARIPSHSVRRLWYRSYLGLEIEEGARVLPDCHMWHFGPRHVRRSGSRIGARTLINPKSCLDLRGGL